MSTLHKKIDYFDTPDGVELLARLKDMVTSHKYETRSSYSPKTDIYENNLIPFVDKHVNYIRTHPQLNPNQYIANLQISTRVR